MAKLGQIKSGTMRVGNTTASGYGIVYADEIIGHRRVNTYADLANIPDWSLYNKAGGETTSAAIGQLWYVTTGDDSGHSAGLYQLTAWSNNIKTWTFFKNGANASNTTYTFANGLNGTFTVTPSGGSAQTVSIGKPATAGTADHAKTADSATKADSATSATNATNATNAGHATSADSATSATKATQDANGNSIVDTYLTKTSASSTYATKSQVSALSSALVYRGTVDAKYALPTKNVKVGDVYVVAAAGMFAGQTCEAGDMIIAQTASNAEGTPAPTWTVVQTNINGAVTASNQLGDGLLVIGNGNRSIRTAGAEYSGFVKIAKGVVTYDDSTYLKSVPKATTNEVGGIKIGFTKDDDNKNYPVQLSGDKAYVHVPWVNTDTKYNVATQSTNGLMSATDKKKLDTIQYPVGITTAQLDLCGYDDVTSLVNAVANQKDGLSFLVTDQNAIVTLQTDNGKHAIIQTIRTATELNNSWEFAAGATSSHKDGALFTYQRFYPIGGTYSTNTHNKWTKWAIIDVDTMYTDGRTNMNTIYKAKGKQLLSNLTVDKNGKITFSSVYSGIDATGIKSESNDILTPIPESEITTLFN